MKHWPFRTALGMCWLTHGTTPSGSGLRGWMTDSCSDPDRPFSDPPFFPSTHWGFWAQWVSPKSVLTSSWFVKQIFKRSYVKNTVETSGVEKFKGFLFVCFLLVCFFTMEHLRICNVLTCIVSVWSNRHFVKWKFSLIRSSGTEWWCWRLLQTLTCLQL